MPNDITVIDLFAGPGGLGEGFSTFDEPGYTPFRIGLSIEKDPFAHKTLRLRSFFRQFPKNEAPSVYYEILREEGGWKKLPSQFSGNDELMKAWIRLAEHVVLLVCGALIARLLVLQRYDSRVAEAEEAKRKYSPKTNVKRWSHKGNLGWCGSFQQCGHS